MRVRWLYTLAGASWGLVLGAAAAVAAVGYALGFSWLFIFGDDRWPEGVGWAYVAIGAVVFALVFSLCALAGYRRGVRLEATGSTSGAGRRALLSIIGSLLVGLALLGALFLRARIDERERVAREAREEALAELVQRRHEITDWVTGPTEEGVAVHLILAGSRSGRYRLSWALSDRLYGAALVRDSSALTLRPGDRNVSISLRTAVVAERYREGVLEGRGGVLVENEFPLLLTVTPLLSEEELAGLPGREVQNLDLGASDLVFRREILVPFRFMLP